MQDYNSMAEADGIPEAEWLVQFYRGPKGPIDKLLIDWLEFMVVYS